MTTLIDIAGKTIARTDTYGTRVYFTDGTALAANEYGFDYLSYAEVQEENHAAQGSRERARMQALRDTLHPRDKQWLAQQHRESEARRYEQMGPFERATVAEFSAMIKSAWSDFNRTAFGGSVKPQRQRRKRRPRRR